ncbi:hypothetical protein [Flavobacterium humidisoli]|uniref:DKNYY family protein n=1 Tax=Flavobacterium humidisoli TaxID=2937442 RepID=A0ABY4LYP9_9FLAO|nr:hypothetical protein [Flavobacterium humidisoli]UPZ17912.1 hypothetical protein M0M44_11300 [Flavobacterium humidisoli]
MKKLLFKDALIWLTSFFNGDNPSWPSGSILAKKGIFTQSGGRAYCEDMVYNDKIVRVIGKDYVIAYTLKKDLNIKTEECNRNGDLDIVKEYHYAKGRLAALTIKKTELSFYSKIKFVHNFDGTVSYKDLRLNSSTNTKDDRGYVGKFIFKDGNLIQKLYSYYEHEGSIVYDYDVKNNPFKNVAGFDFLLDIDMPQS